MKAKLLKLLKSKVGVGIICFAGGIVVGLLI